jgi:hypothetical protein
MALFFFFLNFFALRIPVYLVPVTFLFAGPGRPFFLEDLVSVFTRFILVVFFLEFFSSEVLRLSC